MRTKIVGRMMVVGMVLAVSGMAYGQAPQQAAPIEGTHWKLNWVEGSKVEGTLPRPAFIMLNSGSHRLSGSGGCNSLLGSYDLEGDHLRFTRTGRTMMACASGMETEGKLVDALEKVQEWKISGDELELRDASGHDLARFTAAAGQ